MKVERDKLLSELQTVVAGLDSEATIQQSNCFVFKSGKVMTYNDDAACRTKCCLSITAAINANKMLGVLEKWPEDEIEFTKEKGKLKFKGYNKRGHFKTEDEITLPTQDIEKPKAWGKLPTNFSEVVGSVLGCASTNIDSPHLTCIHITPKFVEACDGTQAARHRAKMPLKESVLIQKKAVERMLNLEVKEFNVTKNWVHFRNDAGLIVSCHKCFEDYPTDRVTAVFKKKGTPTTLPVGLKKVVDRLKVFIDEGKGAQWLSVSLSPGVAKIKAKGAYGSQTERKKVSYNGKPIGFYINPQLLRQLSDKNDECEVTDSTIKIKKGNFHYLTSLWVPSEEKE
jgi:hypothetical protein